MLSAKTYLINKRKMIRKPHLFLFIMLLTLINPAIILLSEVSRAFLVVIPLTLLIWFLVRWRELANIKETSRPVEIIFAVLIYTLNIFRIAISAEKTPIYHGLPDIFLSFLCVCIAFYGVRGLKNFVLPTMYLVLLLVGYHLEYSITQIAFLENALATFASSVLNLITPARVYENIVALQTRNEGLQFLEIDANCSGIKGMIAYGSLAILMIIDVKASKKRKAIVTALGLIGTFCTNLLRLLAIFFAVFFINMKIGMYIHTYLGYGLFIGWMFIFWHLSLNYLSKGQRSVESNKKSLD